MQEKQRNLNEDLKKIETKLEAVLQPISPRPAFVLSLRQRLDEEIAQRQKKAKVKKGLLVAGGIIGGVLMVVALIRSLTSWDEFTHTIKGWFMGQKKEHQAVSA
ncbi:MAG: hypothetical protein MAG431_02333 [Chloroflexi bacterium]|nr:hypothetical protein [Chloroflexota bacterium]